MDEDAEHTLIYVDILGFASLTQKYRLLDIQHPTDENGFEGSSSSEMPNQLNRFSRVVDSCVIENCLQGSLQAMLFSDCAFLDLGNSPRAAMAATTLIRNFITEKVPVRMGIGRGTFYPLKFSAEVSGATVVARSLFVGTAVVHATQAEKCGGKGIRIFVHPSVEPELLSVRQCVRVMDLPKAYENALWELDYLPIRRPAQQRSLEEAADRRLFEAVEEMKKSASVVVEHHYVETLNALNRMRATNSRSPISIPSRNEGTEESH